MGVPVAGGFDREIISRDSRNERYRCSAWVQTPKLSFLIDVGPEFRLQSIRANIKQVDFTLITHEHMDHIGGLDDLRVYNYKQKASIPVYSTASSIESIQRRFDYMFGEDKYPGSTSLDLHVLNDPIEIGDVTITPLPIKHGDLDIYGFRINDLSYLTDVKEIPTATKELIKGSKIMVLSGLRWEPKHPTHITIPEAVEIADELEVPQTYLIHMNGYVNHEETNQKLPSHVRLAYDQLTIEL